MNAINAEASAGTGEATTCEACRRPGGKKRSVLALVLLCAHCTLTGAAVVLTVALASAPTLFGVGLQWILPPVFLLGVFAFLVWPRKPLQHDHPVA